MNNYTISTGDIYFLNDKNIISAIDDNLLTNKINPIASYDVVANMSSYVNSELTNITNNTQYLCTQITSNNTCAIASVDTLHTIINTLSDSISSNYALISTIPLSTSQLSNNGNGENNIYMLNNKLSLASGYDRNNYNLCLVYDGVSIAELNANEFIKDSVLSGVELFDDGNNPYLQFTWIVMNGDKNDKQTTSKIYLSSLTNDLAKQSTVTALSTSIYNYADYLSDTIDNMSSDVSVNLYNLASYRGHITINLDTNKNETLSLREIFHDNTIAPNGVIKNGTIIDVRINSGSNLDTPQYLSTLSYKTADGFVLHNKDFIIVHESTNGRSNIPVEEISSNNVKTITIINEPLFYSLCCTISSDYFWLNGNNTISNNHAISGDNDFINGLNRFEQLSAAKLYANNVDLISGIILNLTANTISSENIDIVSAGISNLTLLNANLSDVCISNLSVNNLSIDLSKLINTNISSSGNYSNVQTFVTSVELSINNLSATLGNKIDIEREARIAADDYLSDAIETICANYATKDELTSEANLRTTAIAELSTAIDNKIFAGEDGQLTAVNSLSVVKIDQESYFALTKDKKANPNTLYIVNAEGEYNMFNERITNLAAPSVDTDATNKAYVDNIQNDIKTKILDSNALSTIYKYGKQNNFDNINCEQIVSALYELISVFCN